jgi:hypothetical protein
VITRNRLPTVQKGIIHIIGKSHQHFQSQVPNYPVGIYFQGMKCCNNFNRRNSSSLLQVLDYLLKMQFQMKRFFNNQLRLQKQMKEVPHRRHVLINHLFLLTVH